AEWIRAQWQDETPKRRAMYFDLADRILAILRTPRGEGEASGLAECIITCMGCGQDFDANDDAQARYHEAACEVVDHEPARVEIARRLRRAALRSEAQEGEADALDLIRWAESRHAALEPVVGNIMPPGTYACYVGDDDPYMGPGILGAIRAASRGEALGDGPVGAVCANCGAPNAAIAGGELDPDEAVCSVECYEQLMELGCPQEHGGTYRPKPARRGEGGGE